MRSVRLFALFMILVTASTYATVFPSLTDRELVDRSEVIAVGTVTSSAARLGPNGYVYTDYQLVVEDVLKGSVDRAATLTIRELGGMLNGRATFIAGSATYRDGERALAFLRPRADGTWFTAAMTLGHFTFGRNIGGEPIVVRDLAGEVANEPARLSDRFLGFISDSARGVTHTTSYVSATPESTVRPFVPVANGNAKSYALFAGGTPVRWPCPVNPAPCSIITPFYQNRTATSAETSAINGALAKWNNDPNSNVSATNGGLCTSATTGNPGPCASTSSPNPDDLVNVIYFDRTNAQLIQGTCDAAIACTIGSGGFTNTYDGDTWVMIDDVDILITTGRNADPAALTHEIGHGLGFRHSDQGTPSSNQAVMRSIVQVTTLQQWDRDAVDSLYGNGPVCNPLASATISGGDRTITAGSTAQLDVTADSNATPPLTYQWYIGLSGDTSNPGTNGNGPTFQTPAINTPTDFWVQVKNCTSGSVNSPSVKLTPTTTTCTKPSITTQPQSQSVGMGTTVTLTVSASGSQPFTYQWFQGLTGDATTPVATTASFTTPPITQQTSYWVRVTNSCGSADSATAVISIIGVCVKPAFTMQPGSTTINSSRPVALVATASGDGVTYQWFNAVAPTETNPIEGHLVSDTRFVRMVSVDLLGRDPDSPTTAILIGLLNASGNHQAFALQVLTGNDYKSALIGSYFVQYLRRAADPAGIAFFSPLLDVTITDEDVAASFFGSDEYFTSVAGGTATGWVTQLYNDVLGRSPSAAEVASTATLITNGFSRSDIALLLLHSTEVRARLVQGWFNMFLRRATTTEELTNFTGALANGQTDEQVMSSIIGSSEYTGFGSVTIVNPPSGVSSYWVKATNTCDPVASVTATITLATGCANTVAPGIVSQPQATSTITGVPATVGVGVSGAGPFTFQWFEGNRGDTSKPITGATKAQLVLLTNTVSTRSVWVQVKNACNQSVNSNAAVITIACGAPAPQIFADTSVRSDVPHKVSWVGDNTLYSTFELQVAKNADFSDAQTLTIPAVQLAAGALNDKIFTDTVTADTRFYYRVRGNALCNGQFSPFSSTATTLVTAPQPSNAPNLVVNVGGNTTFGVVTQNLFIPGFGTSGKNALATTGTFSVTTDRSYITVVPSSGPLPPEGTTVLVKIDPSGLDIGSVQANLVITVTDGLAKSALGTSKTTSTSVSVSRTTPATPTAKDANAPPDTLIVLAVGHGVGGSGPFQSDVRITNTGTAPRQYQLTFTPAAVDGTTTGRQTTMSIKGGETKALDDIVQTWFAAGGLGEANLGTLEVRPLALTTGTSSPGTKTTVAASRTFFVKADGSTFGQFIPAVPIANFLAKGNAKISIQQIQQNTAARSNIGLVEGSGQQADLELKLLDKNNNQIAIASFHMKPFEFLQASLGDFFPNNPGLTTADARLEVKVTSDAGKISAYASIIDSKTSDPTLVFPAVPSQVHENRYVVPGVASLIGALGANFHTDMRIFNSATTAVPVTLAFSGPVAKTQQITMQPGEIRTFSDIVKSFFGLDGVGGAVVATTTANSSLVLTAKTYSLNADGGTFGQFIPGVSPGDGIGVGEPVLHVTELEQSPAYRSNAGLVEVAGQAVMIRVSMINPDAKTVPTVDVPLGPNQFVQLGNVFAQVGMPTVYNGRITVQVLSGTGRVSAYGSVIDNRSNDPTYVPAQK